MSERLIPNRMPPFDNNRYVSAYSEGVKAADKEWTIWIEGYLNKHLGTYEIAFKELRERKRSIGL